VSRSPGFMGPGLPYLSQFLDREHLPAPERTFS
jgi:hypothetical protein